MEELSFKIAGNIALVAWLLLILLPNWRVTRLLVGKGIVPLLLSIGYTVAIVIGMPDSEGSFGSLAGVFMLFQNKTILLAGWIHYLAFDLFVGHWIVTDSRQYQIRHLYLVPILIATFMFGPAGYLVYRLIRFYLAPRQTLTETPIHI